MESTPLLEDPWIKSSVDQLNIKQLGARLPQPKPMPLHMLTVLSVVTNTQDSSTLSQLYTNLLSYFLFVVLSRHVRHTTTTTNAQTSRPSCQKPGLNRELYASIILSKESWTTWLKETWQIFNPNKSRSKALSLDSFDCQPGSFVGLFRLSAGLCTHMEALASPLR